MRLERGTGDVVNQLIILVRNGRQYGYSTSTRESAADTAKFELDEIVKVFNEDNKPVQPGSGEIGMIGTQGAMIGYYKVPKNVLFVEQVQRALNSKADYKWARTTAFDMLGISE